jgi:hypothetical protein
MQRVKRKTYSGVICEQEVYMTRATGADVKNARPPRPRFACEEDRVAHREAMARRKFVRLVNANFSPTSLYGTLTFDNAHELHDFDDARRVRDNFVRRLRYAFPNAVICVVMGRGETTSRIHFHTITEGIPQEEIVKRWPYGPVKRIEPLRAHNYYDNVDHGADYTGLANYLFDHWTAEQGGHHYYITRNAREPESCAAEPCKRVYTEDKPPVMRGYKLVETRSTKYGYIYYKFVKEPEKRPCGRPRKVKE